MHVPAAVGTRRGQNHRTCYSDIRFFGSDEGKRESSAAAAREESSVVKEVARFVLPGGIAGERTEKEGREEAAVGRGNEREKRKAKSNKGGTERKHSREGERKEQGGSVGDAGGVERKERGGKQCRGRDTTREGHQTRGSCCRPNAALSPNRRVPITLRCRTSQVVDPHARGCGRRDRRSSLGVLGDVVAGDRDEVAAGLLQQVHPDAPHQDVPRGERERHPDAAVDPDLLG